MSDWTPTEREIQTPTGPIRYGGPCRDDYPNFETYAQGGGNTVLTLQRPAMRAFKDAQATYAKASHWTKKRREKNPDGKAIKVLPGTNRSCATQSALFKSDPGRYADPKITGHTRGLAIDVDQSQGWLALRRIRRALRLAGWTQTRPDDEPWHYSYGVTI